MRKAVFSVLILLAAVLTAAPGRAWDQEFHQSYTLPAGGHFLLQNVNGAVRVSGWDREEVSIDAVKSARSRPEDLERVEIRVSADKDRVMVDTVYPHDDGVEVSVEYRIRVPHRVLLDLVATVNGKVSVSGVESRGVLQSVNGDVEVFDCAGRLSAHTTNGNLRIELRQLEPGGPLELGTVNGSIALALPADVEAQLDVHSMNGDFRSEIPLRLESSAGARELRARLGGGGSLIRIRAVNGAIRLLVARNTV